MKQQPQQQEKGKPTKRKATVEEITEKVIPSYDEFFDHDFRALVEERVKLAEKKAKIEEREREIREELLPMMEAAEVTSVQVGDYRVIYSEGAQRSKLDPKLLMKNGVKAEVIAKSTIVEKGAPFVTVRKTGARE